MKPKPGASLPVIDVGPARVASTCLDCAAPCELPPDGRPLCARCASAPRPAGVRLGGVNVPLPPELAEPIARIQAQASALASLGEELARGVSTFERALADARRAVETLAPPRARARRARRR